MEVRACEGNRSKSAGRAGGNGGEEGIEGSSIDDDTGAGGGNTGRTGLGASVGLGGTSVKIHWRWKHKAEAWSVLHTKITELAVQNTVLQASIILVQRTKILFTLTNGIYRQQQCV